MRSIIGLVVAIVCKPFALVRMWFRRWISTSGRRGSCRDSTDGIYNWVNNFVGKGRHWIEHANGRKFHCSIQRCITGQVLLTVDFFAGNICSSATLDWNELHASSPTCEDDVHEYFIDKYLELINECDGLYGVQVDALCERLFYEND